MSAKRTLAANIGVDGDPTKVTEIQIRIHNITTTKIHAIYPQCIFGPQKKITEKTEPQERNLRCLRLEEYSHLRWLPKIAI